MSRCLTLPIWIKTAASPMLASSRSCWVAKSGWLPHADEAARTIEAALISSHVMYYPKVLVTVTQYATQNVTVFGQVNKPGHLFD